MDYTVEVSGGAAWGIILGSLLAAVVFYVLSAWLLYRIGKRFNYENSWYAWVPILNMWMMTELAGRDMTFFLIDFPFFRSIRLFRNAEYATNRKNGC